MVSGMRYPGRYFLFSRVCMKLWTCLGLCPHSVTLCPEDSRSRASTVAMEPSPMIDIFCFVLLCLLSTVLFPFGPIMCWGLCLIYFGEVV